jgi:hypothetical protein
MHGVVADKYRDLDDDDREFKWNNYISRHHMRHLDLTFPFETVRCTLKAGLTS